MKNKQTAVEWLESIIQAIDENGGDLGEDYPALLEHIKKAKEKEKEQIMLANGAGYKDGILYANGEQWLYESPEQYYNETYKLD